jgi:hypothetical protein
VKQDPTDSICSKSFDFLLFFHRQCYEGPAVHVSFLKYIRNGNSSQFAWDVWQLLHLGEQGSWGATRDGKIVLRRGSAWIILKLGR